MVMEVHRPLRMVATVNKCRTLQQHRLFLALLMAVTGNNCMLHRKATTASLATGKPTPTSHQLLQMGSVKELGQHPVSTTAPPWVFHLIFSTLTIGKALLDSHSIVVIRLGGRIHVW